MPSHRECYRIVMLIASGWPTGRWFPGGTGFHRPFAASGVRSRQAVLRVLRPLAPPGGSVTTPLLLFANFRSAAPKRCFPVARFSHCAVTDRPSASRCICGSPDSVRRLPEACFPILLRASLPDRSVMFSLSVSAVSRFIFKFGFTVSMSSSCASRTSRARPRRPTYPQMPF